MSDKKSRWLVVLAIPVVIIIVALSYVFFAPARPQMAAIAIDTKQQPTLGRASAQSHIVVFEDLKCFNCALFNNTFFPKIKQRYIDTGVARYTMFNVAFLPNSLPAANAARCLYEQKHDYFFRFVDHIYQIQPPEDQNWATTARLLQFAKESVPEANLAKLSQCIIEVKYNDFLAKNLAYANKIMKGKIATPAIYINGQPLESFTLDAMDVLIKQRPPLENH